MSLLEIKTHNANLRMFWDYTHPQKGFKMGDCEILFGSLNLLKQASFVVQSEFKSAIFCDIFCHVRPLRIVEQKNPD